MHKHRFAALALLLTILLTSFGCRGGRSGSGVPARTLNLQELVAESAKWPKTGKRPELIQFFGIMGDLKPDVYQQPQGESLWRMALNVGVSEADYVRQQGETIPRPLRQPASTLRPEQAFVHLQPGFQPTPELASAFREYVQNRTTEPGQVGINNWEDAKLELKDKNSLLYYHSHRFMCERAFDKPLNLNGCLSPAPDYRPQYATWIMPFKRKALSSPWSEEIAFKVPEFSPQSSGYLLEALQCAARDHDLPLTWTLHCSTPGNTPEDLRRAYYLALAHGVRQFEFRGATPTEFAQKEDSIGGPGAAAMWRTIHDLLQETGKIEEMVFAAKPRRPDVALLISFAQDLWDPDPDRNHERKCLYLTSRISGYNMEFITEEEIQAGKHRHLKAIVTTGNHMERATARELAKFVHAGGALSCFGYSGFRDEHNRPMDILNELHGVTAVKARHDGTLGLTKEHLPTLKPLDRVNWIPEFSKHKFDIFVLGNSFELARGTEIHGRYANDKGIMATRRGFGDGVTWLLGTYMGSAFIRQGLLPARPWKPGPTTKDINHTLPAFPGDSYEIADLVTAPWVDARLDFIKDNMSVEPLVLEGPNGVSVVLINWSPTPQEVSITLQYAPDYAKTARSITRGEIPLKRSFKTVSFKVKVDVTDVVLLPK